MPQAYGNDLAYDSEGATWPRRAPAVRGALRTRLHVYELTHRHSVATSCGFCSLSACMNGSSTGWGRPMCVDPLYRQRRAWQPNGSRKDPNGPKEIPHRSLPTTPPSDPLYRSHVSHAMPPASHPPLNKPRSPPSRVFPLRPALGCPCLMLHPLPLPPTEPPSPQASSLPPLFPAIRLSHRFPHPLARHSSAQTRGPPARRAPCWGRQRAEWPPGAAAARRPGVWLSVEAAGVKSAAVKSAAVKATGV